MRREFRRYRVLILDGDGVLWRGSEPIQQAIRAVRLLIREGRTVVLLTNNSTSSRIGYRLKLLRLGLDIPLERIYPSSYGAARHIAQRGYRSAYVVGEQGLVEELNLAGISVADDADCVVVGMDRGFTYAKLARASALVRNGAYFVATNRDATLPTESGLIPGAGSMVVAIEVAAGKRADITIGKPEPYLYRMVLEDLSVEPSEVLAVGDRLDTDVAGAHNAGIDSLLVLTGVAKKEDVETSPVKPTYVLEDLSQIFES